MLAELKASKAGGQLELARDDHRAQECQDLIQAEEEEKQEGGAGEEGEFSSLAEGLRCLTSLRYQRSDRFQEDISDEGKEG